MIGLTIALLLAGQAAATPGAAPQGRTDQAVPARLDSCALEQGRWVCRYTVPAVEIIPFVGDATTLTETDPNDGGDEVTTTTRPATTAPITTASIQPPVTPATTTTAPVMMETTVLTEAETRLMTRCADAGWMSLCLPDDRRQARALKEKETSYLSTLRAVTGLIAEERCDEAVRSALDGGYLALARQARDFCAAPASEPVRVRAVDAPN